jgi:hypothetical protein
MKRDLQQPLHNLLNAPLLDEEKKQVMLSTVCVNALMNSYPDEQTLTGKEKADRYHVAMKIQANPGRVDLTVEQLTLLKLLVGKAYGPLVVGQVYDLLEMTPKLVEAPTEGDPS